MVGIQRPAMNLECFIIATDNDFIHQYHAIRQRGYDVTIFPASFDKSLLTDARSKECSGYFVDVHAHTDEFVRNLRQSWCAMLRSAGDKEGIIFCEADALPLMRAGIVAEKLRRDEENHPDCDVWKLYPEILLNAPVGLAPSNEAGFSFHDWPKYERDACVKSVWGTHALYIPAKSRGKVAKVFSELPMPVDVALEYANYKGDLKVRECSYPLFAQCQHAQQAVVEPRVAAVMSTYNRDK